MAKDSVNRTDYAHKQGERYPTKKPKDSGVFKRDGTIEKETVTGQEFKAKRGDRHSTSRPRTSDIWKVEIKKTFP